MPVRCSHVRLPKLVDHVKHSTGGAQAKTLLGVFRQLLPMCTTQRYFFANQPRIIMQGFETFQQATLLTEAQLQINLDTNLSLNPNRVIELSSECKKKARASLVSLFGSLLELNTGRTFWRMMELTTEAYITLLESYEEEADQDHAVLTGKARSELLQWIGHVFWSLKHAQDVLRELRKLQLAVYLHNKFPFYPWDLDALKRDPEGDLDVHLIIIKLIRCPAHDFHLMTATFNALRRASDEYPAQMVHVNYAMMVAIDEMSARFRVLELLTRVGQVIATRTEVKTALFSFKFDEFGVELHSTVSEAGSVLSDVDNFSCLNPTPDTRSFLQELLVLERDCRNKYKEKFLTLPVQDSRDLTRELFGVFKPTYTKLYRELIRHLWKRYERSLLSSEARTEHRLAFQPKKTKKKASAVGAIRLGGSRCG